MDHLDQRIRLGIVVQNVPNSDVRLLPAKVAYRFGELWRGADNDDIDHEVVT